MRVAPTPSACALEVLDEARGLLGCPRRAASRRLLERGRSGMRICVGATRRLYAA